MTENETVDRPVSYVSLAVSIPVVKCDALGPERIKATLPPGCKGVLYVWESKEKAREWYGNIVPQLEFGIVEHKEITDEDDQNQI